MASSPSLVICDDEITETMSVYNCIFCNILLNGQAVMLDCLHVICYKCVREKKNDSGLLCKCLTVTKNVITDYPIVSSSVSMTKTCDTCDSMAKKNCISCEKFYCKSCSKVHLTSSEGLTHSPKLVISYPMKSKFVLCLKCFKESTEVFCTECSMMICSLCHLHYHRTHHFKVLNELCESIKISLSEELLKLNKNEELMEHAVNQTSKETQKLLNQKKNVFVEIDTIEQKLHDEIKKRSLELKKLADSNFKDCIDQINKKENILLDIKKNNKYYMNLVQTILELDKIDDIMTLSKFVLKKLNEPSHHVLSLSDKFSELKFGVKFEPNKSLENCISAIKNVGLIEISKNNSEDIINLPASNANDNQIIQEDNLVKIPIINNDSDTETESSDYEPLPECACCNQWAEKLIQCSSCNRHFHHDCHIPYLPENMYDDNSLQTNWKCTICLDITRYTEVLNLRDMNGEISVSKTELIIMERILMEIYCQNSDSEHYRELPNDEVYPSYYQKVTDPLALNNIKTTLESNKKSYTSLIQFLKDLKHVFSNGLLYYSPCDPYYKSASNLQLFLDRLINKWIPKLRDDNRLR